MYVGRTEDIALRAAVHVLLLLLALEIALAVPVVIASAAAEDVAHDMAAPQIDLGFSAFVDGGRLTTLKAIVMLNVGCVFGYAVCMYGAAPHRPDLAATIEAAAHEAVPHVDVGSVDVAVGHVAAAEDVAALVQFVVTRGLVVKLRHVAVVELG